ncbi:hypothetical protein BGZ95_010275 [Linnemannia exigua]|uniref:L domain-like protein n=1 Tax=Linnemannia exigua TaxID=604196 RepID=A0AAD4H603_9FUNG|nr:hypothetical protein BGZ95_010275 [Linnemannia exigua]
MTIRGYRRATKTLLLPLLFLLILTILQAGAFVSAEEEDRDGDGEPDEGSRSSENDDTFADPGDLESDPSDPPIPTLVTLTPIPTPAPIIPEPPAPSSPSPVPTPTSTPSAPAPIAPPRPPPPPAPLPTVPSGIIKAGTRSSDCAVIADLYKATGPWQFVPDTENCCNAEYPNSSGIKCNSNNRIIYIYLADLSHNRLSGSLPSSAPGWVGLGTLNLEQNSLSGSLPDWITTLPNLHSLAIGQNSFTTGDPVPPFTFNLEPTMASATATPADMVNLRPPGVPFNVTPENIVVPSSVFLESFTRLPKLKQLKVDSLGISGSFPISWQSRMVNLTKLDVSNNSMQGQIPGFLNEFVNLKTLLLDRNEFGGAIPSFKKLRSLSVLDLSYNQLSGPLPPWSAGLNLTVLNLSNNLLSGPLPLDNHHYWRTCSVSNNYFQCIKGPEQILSAKWKADCRATCTDEQQPVPFVRPPINTTLTAIKVRPQNDAQVNTVSSTARWISVVALLSTVIFLI